MTFAPVAAITVPADVRVGSLITNAQHVTGAWEQTVVPGLKVVGLEIELRTSIHAANASFPDTPKRVEQIWITTYERRSGRSERTVWSTGNDGQFSWASNRLILRKRANGADGPLNLDLTFDPRRDLWRGHFQDVSYNGDVLLQRPFVAHTGYKIIGDWIWGDPRNGGYSCEHIALGGDSALVIWSDILDFPETFPYVNGTKPALTSPEWYGDFGMDAETKYVGTNLLFFTGTDFSGDLVLGNVDKTGDVFSGQFAHFGNGYSTGDFDRFTWQRSTPDCQG